MRAVIQRVSAADVVVNGGAPRAIGRGLMILLGVRDTDTLDVCEKLAQKCAGLRIFEDAGGKLNVSAEELGCEALVVSISRCTAIRKRARDPVSSPRQSRRFRWRRMKHSWPSCEKQAWPVWRRVNSVPI